MHAGFFNVLHDSADDHVGSVGQRVHIDFRGFLKELIDQHRFRRAHQCGLGDVILHGVHVIGNHHGAATEHIARPDQDRQADFAGHAGRFFRNQRGSVARLRNFQFVEQPAETAAVFRQIDRFGSRANDWYAVAFQFQREIQRSLTAELHDYALRFFFFNDCQHIFQSKRFEIEAVGSVVVRRNSLRIAIHHDGFETIFAQCERGVAAAIIKFDSLPNAVWTAAQNHNLGPCMGVGLVFVFVGGIEVRRERFKFRRASIDALEHGSHPVARSLQAHGSGSGSPDLRQLLVAGSVSLYFTQKLLRSGFHGHSRGAPVHRG